MNSELSTLLMEQLHTPNGDKFELKDMLKQMAEQDPRMGMLTKLLAQREAERNHEAETEHQVIESRTVQRQESLRRLQGLVQKLYREVKVLRQRNDTLAAALGSCYLCWGEDPLCMHCGGQGQPGASPPDAGLFSELITPAVKAMRAESIADYSLSLPGGSATEPPTLKLQ